MKMTIRTSFVLGAVFVVILAAIPVAAHHSFAAQYDGQKRATFTGPVTKIDWINPHARFFVDVKDATSGKVTNWEIELSAPAMLMRRGWSQNSLKIGQVVTVNVSLAKNGAPIANASTVTLADGKRLFAGSSEGDAS